MHRSTSGNGWGGAILNGIVLASRAVGALAYLHSGGGYPKLGLSKQQQWRLRTDGDVGNNPATTPTQLDSAERSAFGVGFGMYYPTSTALWQT